MMIQVSDGAFLEPWSLPAARSLYLADAADANRARAALRETNKTDSRVSPTIATVGSRTRGVADEEGNEP